MVFGAQA